MSIKQSYVCNVCKKRVDDKHVPEGWYEVTVRRIDQSGDYLATDHYCGRKCLLRKLGIKEG